MAWLLGGQKLPTGATTSIVLVRHVGAAVMCVLASKKAVSKLMRNAFLIVPDSCVMSFVCNIVNFFENAFFPLTVYLSPFCLNALFQRPVACLCQGLGCFAVGCNE